MMVEGLAKVAGETKDWNFSFARKCAH